MTLYWIQPQPPVCTSLYVCVCALGVFQCYDVDGDGYISGTDLFHVLKMMVSSSSFRFSLLSHMSTSSVVIHAMLVLLTLKLLERLTYHC